VLEAIGAFHAAVETKVDGHRAVRILSAGDAMLSSFFLGDRLLRKF